MYEVQVVLNLVVQIECISTLVAGVVILFQAHKLHKIQSCYRTKNYATEDCRQTSPL